MIEKDAMTVADLVSLMATLVTFITKLQSPHRSNEFIEWFNPFARYMKSLTVVDDALLFVPKFFEVASGRLEQMQNEIANYYLSSLAPFAQNEGSDVLKDTVNNKIAEYVGRESSSSAPIVVEEHYTKYLPRTAKYLCDQLNDTENTVLSYLRDIQALGIECDAATDIRLLGIGSTTSKNVNKALMARAFSLLLQKNIDLTSPVGVQYLPETFLWDGKRLRNLKNEIDSLVLVTTLLISCRSFLISAKKRLSTEQEVSLQDMLFEVLRDESVSLIDVVTTAQNFVRTNCTKSGAEALPPHWERTLEESLKKCVSQSSPVFSLFSKRVHNVLVRAILDVPFTEVLNGFSMNSRPQLQQLKLIITLSRSLFLHNTKTFNDVYTSIFRMHMR
jgi:hypothetical protein